MQYIKWLFKIITASIVAVAIISVLLCFYSISPVHEENRKGNTDYVWPANSIWVEAMEGIAFGKNDANGFNNKAVIKNPDIIILGSSHMEAFNVMQDENTAYILSQKLNGKYSVYNMGIAGHNFFKVCQYIPANLKLYDYVPKLVIIETDTVILSKTNVNQVISSQVEYTPSYNTGIIGLLQNIPFFRALHRQITRGLLKLFIPNSNKTDSDTQTTVDETEIDSVSYKELFSYLKNIEKKYGTRIIIFFHPTGKLMEDGTIYFDRNEYLSAFTFYAREFGISFINMTNRFEKMYYEQNHVAHGFCTGELAAGHLNKYGHRAIADELYKEIIRLEETKIL